MDTQVNSRYGQHREADAPQAMPGLDRRVPEVLAIPPALRAQRRQVNAIAAAEPADLAAARVAAYYGRLPGEAQRCTACGYIAWDLVAGVCGACRRG